MIFNRCVHYGQIKFPYFTYTHTHTHICKEWCVCKPQLRVLHMQIRNYCKRGLRANEEGGTHTWANLDVLTHSCPVLSFIESIAGTHGGQLSPVRLFTFDFLSLMVGVKKKPATSTEKLFDFCSKRCHFAQTVATLKSMLVSS